MSIQLFASGAVAFGNAILMGTGFYLAVLRPPLLPEDLRYVGVSLAQI